MNSINSKKTKRIITLVAFIALNVVDAQAQCSCCANPLFSSQNQLRDSSTVDSGRHLKEISKDTFYHLSYSSILFFEPTDGNLISSNLVFNLGDYSSVRIYRFGDAKMFSFFIPRQFNRDGRCDPIAAVFFGKCGSDPEYLTYSQVAGIYLDGTPTAGGRDGADLLIREIRKSKEDRYKSLVKTHNSSAIERECLARREAIGWPFKK